MSKIDEQAVAMSDDGVRHYMYLCFGSLLVMALCMSLRGLEMWSLLPALVGAMVLVFRWRTGPLLVLVLVAWLLGAQRWSLLHPLVMIQEIVVQIDKAIALLSGESPMRSLGSRPTTLSVPRSFLISDLALCASILVYVAANFRLQGLVRQIYPGDPRLRQARVRPRIRAIGQRRSTAAVTPREIVTLVAGLPIWIGLAWLCIRWLVAKESPFDLDDGVWRSMLLAWLLGLVSIVAFALLSYLAKLRMPAEEAAMFLQDTLWRETAREQRRDDRWWVWWRRRQGRREGP
jgi:hypothetical protein